MNIAALSHRISAGFPSPAEDFIEDHIDLNQYLTPNPETKYLMRVSGNSMIGAGIFSGDLLIIDKSKSPHHNDIVIAALNGELTVKRLCHRHARLSLIAENSDYPPIHITPDMDFFIWGVVTHAIKNFVSPHA